MSIDKIAATLHKRIESGKERIITEQLYDLIKAGALVVEQSVPTGNVTETEGSFILGVTTGVRLRFKGIDRVFELQEELAEERRIRAELEREIEALKSSK